MAGSIGGDGEPEFQVAPMIDVLLTILVFFMTITSAQVLKVDKTIKLPLAPDAQKKENQRSEAIVNVRWHADVKRAEFVLNDHVYNKSTELLGPLRAAKAAGDKIITADPTLHFRLVIRGDRDAPALYISQAMNAGGEAGITDISFSAVNKD